MDEAAMRSYVDRVTTAIEEDPSMSARTAELRVTQPLLDALGWDLYGSAVEADFETPAGAVGFGLHVDGTPVAVVETVSPETELSAEHGTRVLEAMRAGGVPYGLLTNGRTFVFVSVERGTPDSRRCAVTALPEHLDWVTAFAPDVLAERASEPVGERIAAARENLVADLADRVLAATDGRAEDRVRAATAAFVDELAAELGATSPTASETDRGDAAAQRTDNEGATVDTAADAEDGVVNAEAAPAEIEDTGRTPAQAPDDDVGVSEATSEGTTEATGHASGGPAPSVTASERVDDSTGARREAEADDPETTAEPAHDVSADVGEGAAADDGPAANEGEYVCRFFDARTSVGAVGSGTPTTTLVQVLEFLERRRGTVTGLSVPWRPDGSLPVVLNHDPVHEDGRAMASSRELPTGHYLYTGLDEAGCRTAVEELASAAGLRVMFQGDW
jgi:hypothetical protein